MGQGMVKNIAEKGSFKPPFLIYNRTTKKAEKFANETLEKGKDKVKVSSSIEECVKESDYIFTCVGDDAAIRETIDTALKGGSKGKLFVDLSTIHPDTTNELAKKITDAGAEFVACPVFGAPPMAWNGQLVTVLAGPKKSVDKVKPFTKDVIARADVDFSDQECGAATRLKIIGNTFILNMVEILSEGYVLAEKSGLGIENLHSFVETMFGMPYTAYSARMKSGDYYLRESPAFAAKLAKKDYDHAKSLADRAGVQVKSGDVAGKHLQDVIDYDGDHGDMAGIYGAVRVEAGLKFENQGDRKDN